MEKSPVCGYGPPAGSEEVSQNGFRLAGGAVEERPGAAARRDIAVARPVAPLPISSSTSFQEVNQRCALAQGVSHRGARRTLQQRLWLQFQYLLAEFANQPHRRPLAHCQPLLRPQRQSFGEIPPTR